jgi:hypothetical protein
LPSSDPVANGPAVWSYDATAGSPGVSVAGDAISLNLTVAKLKTGLSAGNYWLVVYPDLPCNDAKNTGCTEGWFWNNSWYGSGQVFALTSSASGAAWSNKGNLNYGSGPGLAMTITTTVGCGALPGWLTLTPNGGEGSATASTPGVVQFSASAAGYAPSTSASTYVCFDSGYQEPTLGVTLPRGAVPVQVNAKN